MFTVCTGRAEFDSHKNSISGITEKIGLEKRLSDDFDKVITGEMKGNKEDFIGVIDFDLLDYYMKKGKIFIYGKNFRRMFFSKYTIFSGEEGTLTCRKGICINITLLLLTVMLVKFASLLFVTSDFYISFSICGVLLTGLFVFFYNFKKWKEEKDEIEMLLDKVIE